MQATQTQTRTFDRISTERLDRAAGKLSSWLAWDRRFWEPSRSARLVRERYEALLCELDRRHHARLAQVRPC